MSSGPVRTARLTATTHPSGPASLVDAVPGTGGFAWIRAHEGLVGAGRAARVDPGTGDGRFRRAADALRAMWSRARIDEPPAAFGAGPVAFGTFTFDPEAQGSSVIVPAVVHGLRDGLVWTTRVASDDAVDGVTSHRPEVRPGRIRYAGSTLSEVAWLEAVDRAVAAIRAGELDKVVLARDMLVWSDASLDPRVLVRRLAHRFPECFTFSFDGLIGASPELLLRRRGRRVESLVLAGSAARGTDARDDAALGESLLASDKDVAEHRLAVESVTRVLHRMCSTLDVDASPGLLRLQNIQHLATAVRGELATDMSALELAGELHPTSAVCGEPAERALETIRALEGMERGCYGGPVGWVDADGDGEWAIALRCAEISGARARLFAGAGVVDGSRPEGELEETRLKFRAMLSALEDG